jgi:hypothetical protein
MFFEAYTEPLAEKSEISARFAGRCGFPTAAPLHVSGVTRSAVVRQRSRLAGFLSFDLSP